MASSALFMEMGDGLSMMLGLPAIESWETKNRPKKPRKGTIGFNSETNSLEYWDGTSWFEAGMSAG
jgi:hypothetical protein